MNFGRSVKVKFEGVQIPDVENLRVSFEVSKNNGIQFNHGIITIYNFSPSSRAKIARPHPLGFPMMKPIIKVSLFAGYEGKEILLLAADILSAINEKNGPNWMTRIEAYSGMADAVDATTQESFSLPTAAKRVADQLLGNLGLDVKYTADAISALANQKVSDFATSGMAMVEASDFLSRYGLAFTIEGNGQGLVYLEDRARNPDGGKTNDNTFKPSNGLLGTPKITRSGVEFKSLMRQRMKIFERIFVESATTTGTLQASPDYSPDYHIVNMKHVGDNRGPDWYTEFVCAYSKLAEGVY